MKTMEERIKDLEDEKLPAWAWGISVLVCWCFLAGSLADIRLLKARMVLLEIQYQASSVWHQFQNL